MLNIRDNDVVQIEVRGERLPVVGVVHESGPNTPPTLRPTERPTKSVILLLRPEDVLQFPSGERWRGYHLQLQ